jgi:hypothetical protein
MTKAEKFRKNLPIECIKHGIHNEWSYLPKYHQVNCRKCVKERARKYRRANWYVFSKFVSWIKSRSKRGVEIGDIDEKYLCNLYLKQNGFCALSGVALNEDNLSVDRIDSSKGYIRGNVQWVDVYVNKMKSDLLQDHFIKLCKLIAKIN